MAPPSGVLQQCPSRDAGGMHNMLLCVLRRCCPRALSSFFFRNTTAATQRQASVAGKKGGSIGKPRSTKGPPHSDAFSSVSAHRRPATLD